MAVVFDQQSVGLNPSRDTCYVKLGRTADDTQAYICMDYKRGNPVLALHVHVRVGGNGPG